LHLGIGSCANPVLRIVHSIFTNKVKISFLKKTKYQGSKKTLFMDKPWFFSDKPEKIFYFTKSHIKVLLVNNLSF